MTLPPWAPSLSDVGDRIPTKTRDSTNPGSDSLLNIFNDRTVPTDGQVQPIINGAVGIIASAVTTALGPDLHDLANDAAAWRAAADVELAYPDRNADVAVYQALDARAKFALTTLANAADQAGQGSDATYPAFTFPVPVPWGDEYL